MTTFVRDPRHPCWGHPAFPDFITEFRDHQWDAFVEITNAYANGADVVLVDAPVGSGKTLIGEMVRRWFNAQALYVCSGKSLQDQFVRDFTYAKVLKGRSNYPTADHPELFDDRFNRVTAADCAKSKEFLPACVGCPSGGDESADTADDEVLHCDECHPVSACPYERAKAIALNAKLACVNTSYFLAEANGPGKLRARPLVIVDECDMLEGELMSFFEVTISERQQRRWGIEPPLRKTERAGMRERDDGSIDWPDWFEKAMTALEYRMASLPKKPTEREQRREVEALGRLYGRLRLVKDRIMGGGWVYTGYERGDVTFKPVTVDQFGNETLWCHGDQWLLMSGTIIDPVEMVTSLGLPEDKQWATVQVPMTFPKENRPLHVIPTADVTAKNKDKAWPALAARCNEIADLHPDDRILIHGVSYALTQFLVDRLPRDRTVTYSAGSEREWALARYKEIPNGILVGPSLDRGIDLPGDWCMPAGTRVLTDDLNWLPIEELRVGDQIVGFDEERSRPGAHHAMRIGEVQATASRDAETFLITTTHGTVTATAEHPFLAVRLGHRSDPKWTPVEDLRAGDRLRWVTPPVNPDRSWGGGYLAGFFDGEGSITRTTRDSGYQKFDIVGVQKPGVVLDTVKDLLDERGFQYVEYPRDNGVHELRLRGKMSEKFRFLSSIRPERLVNNAVIDGLVGSDGFCAEILSIEPAGVQRVYNIQTSTSTFVAEGFATHNCRVQVVCKLPFPYLGDKQISTRLYTTRNGQTWYLIQCIRSFVQMTGRGVRNESDWATTYILDNAFQNNIWKKARHLLPGYMKEAIDWSGRLPKKQAVSS